MKKETEKKPAQTEMQKRMAEIRAKRGKGGKRKSTKGKVLKEMRADVKGLTKLVQKQSKLLEKAFAKPKKTAKK